MAPQKSAGVALRGESEEDRKKQSNNKARNFPYFEVQDKFHQKSKTWASMARAKEPMFFKN